jgi:acetylornithine deacetylase
MPDQRKDVKQLLMDLVAIPSVSPMTNQPVIDYVTRQLDPRVWRLQTHSYTDPAGTLKTNLVAIAGNTVDNRAELTFVCHTDTVPFEPDWTEAVHPVVRDGRLYGRGSCDVKGFLACTLAALSDVDLSSLAQPVALVLTADEEVGCVGAKSLAAAKAFSTRYMIIGEPTGLRPIRAGKGYGLAMITLRGREAHSAFPTEGRSAIYDAARVLLLLEQLAGELKVQQDSTFDPPFTTLNVGVIEGGTAKNIIPGECRITVEWRPIPGEDRNRVPDMLRDLLARATEVTPEMKASLEICRIDPAFAPSATQQIAGILSEMTGNQPATIAFGSEAAHFRELTGEAVVFGPGNMTVAHKSGEFVPVVELERCADYLRTVIARICQAGQTAQPEF